MWRHYRSRLVVVVWVTTLSFGCSSPLKPSLITGDWSGRDVPSHFAYIEIRFEQQGSQVVGTACSYDGPYLNWTGVPVTVDDRRITFSVRTSAGTTRVFRAEFNEEGTSLKGSWVSQAGQSGSEVTLQRGGSLCANKIRLP